MPRLTIVLEDGFAGEPVVVLVDGAVVLDVADARTRHQVGLAATTSVDAPPRCRVEATLPRGGRAVALDVDVARTPHVWISRGPDGLRADAGAQPHFYA